MSWTASRSVSASSALEQAPLDGLAAARGRRRCPPPSSMIVMTTWFDSWAAESRMVPVGVLPRATPLRRRLDAVVDAVADQVHEGLADLVDDGLVDARAPRPRGSARSPCPVWRARSRTRRGKRSKTWRMGSIRTSMTVSWSWLRDARPPGARRRAARGAASCAGRAARRASFADLLELGAVDDQLARPGSAGGRAGRSRRAPCWTRGEPRARRRLRGAPGPGRGAGAATAGARAAASRPAGRRRRGRGAGAPPAISALQGRALGARGRGPRVPSWRRLLDRVAQGAWRPRRGGRRAPGSRARPPSRDAARRRPRAGGRSP